jgi:hypothetical protein
MEEANQCVDDNMSKETRPPSVSEKLSEGSSPSSYGDDLTLAEALFERTSNATPTTWGSEEFTKQIRAGYRDDKLFTLILDKPKEHREFVIKDGLIWRNNQHHNEVVCIPRDRAIVTQILDQAHAILGHFGDQRTAEYI